jgi:hypothetical protein
MNINDIGTTAIVSLLTFFLGLFLGHRLSLSRDKRKEYNEVADIVYFALINEKRRIGMSKGPTEKELLQLLRRSSYIDRFRIKTVIDKYIAAKKNIIVSRSPYGEPLFSNIDNVVTEIDSLIKCLERK